MQQTSNGSNTYKEYQHMSIYHRYHFVYKTTNLKNQKYYIGIRSTNNLNDGYIGSGKHLGLAIKKYGKENFKREILYFLYTREMAAIKESELVTQELVDDPNCYNLKTGGFVGFSYNDEWKRLVGERSKIVWTGRKHKPETIEKMKKAVARRIEEGNYITDEMKEKISNTLLNQSKETSKRVKKDWENQKHSEWRKQRMKEGWKAKPYVKCPHCDKMFNNNLQRHVKAKHAPHFELMS
jgi:hypothetical protein